MSTIRTLGPVGLNPAGEYDSTKQYEKLDLVEYQGSSYVAVIDSKGQPLTNTTYWQKIVEGSIHINYDAITKTINIAINGDISYNSERKELNITTA